MHWLGYNDAVSWLNEAKTRIFQPTANFENFKIYHISSINTASLISTAVWYYSNTNNIEFNVYFNSNAPSNNTA